ncbi:MAG: LPS assembly protein LptD [Thermoanaerobaculia bacterium]
MRPIAAVLWLWLLACPLAAQFEELEPANPIPDGAPAEVVEEQEEATEPEPPEPIRFDRISFEVPFPEEQGGGTATGTAGNLEYLRENFVIASGGVEVRYQDMEFQGQQVEIDLETKVITARGDVIIDQGPKRMTGDTLTFDLESKTGSMTNAKAFVDPDMYFEGKEIAKVGEDTYTVTDGMVTSCSGDSPAWNFRVSRAQVEMEGFARAKHARFRVKKMPLLYTPYMVYPAKTERTSGFLFPNLGYSERQGAVLGLAYFQTLGESADTTFYLDLYTEKYTAVGNEIRYRPSEATEGFFEGYVVDDPESEDLRWKLNWTHTSDDLPWGMRGVVRYRNFSDFDFFRDFERDFNKISIRRLRSAGFVTGSWGQHSFTLLVEGEETFVNDDTTVDKRRLPEAEYRLRATQLGRLPIYVDLLSSVDYFSQQRTDAFDFTYARADLLPQMTFALSSLPWLSASVIAAPRVTWYSDSLNEEEPGLSGESLTRTLFSSTGTIVGPSAARIYNSNKGFFTKYKHIIEPRWSYAYVDDFDDQNRVIEYDEIDRFQPTSVVRYNFINRLLAKPAEETGLGAREIMSLSIAQAFSLDKDRPLQKSSDGTRESRQGPVAVQYRFNPSQMTNLEARFSYNTLFNGLNNTSLTAGFRFGQHALGTTWVTRFNAETDTTRGNQLRFLAGLQLWPNRVRLDSQLNYDFVTQVLQSQRYVISITAQCFGIRLEYQELDLVDDHDRRFRFALSLKNIGTFIDLTGGTSTGGFNSPF